MPSSSSPASEPSGSAIAARCASAAGRSSSRRCASTMATGSASPAAAAATSFRWNSAGAASASSTSASHVGYPLLAGRRQRVDLSVRPLRLPAPASHDHEPALSNRPNVT